VSTTTTTATSTTTTAVPGVDAEDVARRWIDAIGSGDDDAAIALTAPRSLEAFGGPDGFRDREIELAEGWGAWSRAEDLELTAVDVPTGAIVVLHGQVSQEGPPEESRAALPIVTGDDGGRVEAFLDLGAIEIHPDAGSAIPRDPRFTAFALVGRDVRFIVDANPAVVPAITGADGDQQQADLDFRGLDAGRHALTVVLSDDSGAVTARTFEYTVAD
jgi:hypothetical protein